MKPTLCQLMTFACFLLCFQLNYKVEGEKLKHKYTIDSDLPQFIQAKVNALNMSDVSICPGVSLILLTWASGFQFWVTVAVRILRE